MIGDLISRIDRLEQIVSNIVRVGTVSSLMPDKGIARVEIHDADGLVSYDLPILYPKTQDDKYYWMPDIGEHVVCVFLPSGFEQGFIIGSIYSQSDKVPVPDRDKAHIKFSDGTTIEYDRKIHKLEVNCVGEVVVKSATHIQTFAPRIDMN